jgi:hypothetical protein
MSARWIALLIGLLAGPAHAGAGTTHGTADVIEEGAWELGVYAPASRGLGDGLQVSIHPLTAVLSPHIAVKKAWGSAGSWRVATRHSIAYPTHLLRFLAREGTGGIIVADAEIPHILALDSRLISSRSLSEATTLSLSARLMLGAGLGPSDWPSIDMPIAYSRTAAYRDHMAAALGAQLDGTIIGTLGYQLDVDAWTMPLSAGKWATELRASVPWRPTEGFTAMVGSTAVVGAYPYGLSWHVLPRVDAIWAW